MDSPTEYIRQLENENRCLRGDRARLADELSRAQLRALEAEESARAMTSAASSSAATAATALERVQLHAEIADAVVAWYRGEDDAGEWLRDVARAEAQRRERRA